jgi:hypothetical protein
MATRKKRKSWDSYEDYLKSPEWAAIRKTVHKRDGVVCQICAGRYEEDGDWNCHHWRYPSDWNDDWAGNVVLVCATCHDDLHREGFDYEAATYAEYLSTYLRDMCGAYDNSICWLTSVVAANDLAVMKVDTLVLRGHISTKSHYRIGDTVVPENIGRSVVRMIKARDALQQGAE